MNAPLLSLALAAAVGTPLSVAFFGGGSGGGGTCATKVQVKDCSQVSIQCCPHKAACAEAEDAEEAEDGGEAADLAGLGYLGSLGELAELAELEDLQYVEGFDELDGFEEAFEVELERAMEQFEAEMEAFEQEMEATYGEDSEDYEAFQELSNSVSSWSPEASTLFAASQGLVAQQPAAVAGTSSAQHEAEVTAHMQALEALLAGQAAEKAEVEVARSELQRAQAAEVKRAAERAADASRILATTQAAQGAWNDELRRATEQAAQAGQASAAHGSLRRSPGEQGEKGKVIWLSADGEKHTLELDGDGPHRIYIGDDGEGRAIRVDGHEAWTSSPAVAAPGVPAVQGTPKVYVRQADGELVEVDGAEADHVWREVIETGKAKDKAKAAKVPKAPKAPKAPRAGLFAPTPESGTFYVTPELPAPAPAVPGMGQGDLAELKELLEGMRADLQDLRSSVQDLRSELRDLQPGHGR